MKPLTLSTPIHRMSERPACSRCGQPVVVVEIEDPALDISPALEQQIVCPQCRACISALMSFKRVLAYPAPVGDYQDEAELDVCEADDIPLKPVGSASSGRRQRRVWVKPG
jgi:hypothetical protein